MALADRRGISLGAALSMSNWEAELWIAWYFPEPAADPLDDPDPLKLFEANCD